MFDGGVSCALLRDREEERLSLTAHGFESQQGSRPDCLSSLFSFTLAILCQQLGKLSIKRVETSYDILVSVYYIHFVLSRVFNDRFDQVSRSISIG